MMRRTDCLKEVKFFQKEARHISDWRTRLPGGLFPISLFFFPHGFCEGVFKRGKRFIWSSLFPGLGLFFSKAGIWLQWAFSGPIWIDFGSSLIRGLGFFFSIAEIWFQWAFSGLIWGYTARSSELQGFALLWTIVIIIIIIIAFFLFRQ